MAGLLIVGAVLVYVLVAGLAYALCVIAAQSDDARGIRG